MLHKYKSGIEDYLRDGPTFHMFQPIVHHLWPSLLAAFVPVHRELPTSDVCSPPVTFATRTVSFFRRKRFDSETGRANGVS